MTAERSEAVPAALLDATDALASTALAMARRFAAGATLWCVAPEAPHHARHVAVEFVHPVVVGTRSLPAAALEGSGDVVGRARVLVRPGDVVLAVGAAGDEHLARLLRRGDAWGVTTVLIAVGDRPRSGIADHVLWAGESDDGGTLLTYHLLWELTHVVFEHPGLLTEPRECTDEACVTCADEGRVAEVCSIVDDHTVMVLADGREERVDTSVVTGVAPGDLVLVHAGMAISVVEGGVLR